MSTAKLISKRINSNTCVEYQDSVQIPMIVACNWKGNIGKGGRSDHKTSLSEKV